MFKNERYVTCGVAARIPLVTQLMMWAMIDDLKAVEVDSFQIFFLSPSNEKQKITQKQEVPEFRRELSVDCEEPVTEKVYVIDSIEYSTMLLAEEY